MDLYNFDKQRFNKGLNNTLKINNSVQNQKVQETWHFKTVY